MKNLIIILVFLMGKSYSQVLVLPSSSITCNTKRSIITFTLNSGWPPYTFTVQSPSCTSSFTSVASIAHPTFALNCSGIYTFTIVDGLNVNMGSYTHAVSQNTSIILPIESEPERGDSICLGTLKWYSVRDSLNKYTLSHFNWNTGDTSRLILVAPVTTTTYSFTALLTSGSWIGPPTKTCSASGHTTINVKLCDSNYVGIETGEILTGMTVYPNPTSDKLILKYEYLLDIVRISVINTLGETVLVQTKQNRKEEIELSELQSGFYYLVVETNKGQKNMKILKE